MHDEMIVESRVTPSSGRRGWYLPYLLFIAGLGGLLIGIDIGIIAAALLYLNKTINLSEWQTSFIVAAVFGGTMISSLVAGVLADWAGRKKIMVVSGLVFVISVLLIYTSQGFLNLLLGRLLMGLSCGVIAVVVPLYLAECLTSTSRGRGTALFQFMLTFGIVVASLVGVYFTARHESAVAAAKGDASLILAADNAAWRGMFLMVVFPGIVYAAGTLPLTESPRWLFRRGRRGEAESALRLSRSTEQATRELEEMREHTARRDTAGQARDRLLRRKYVVPFVLACIVLACTQATGITTVLQYLVLILKQAGMSDFYAANGDLTVKVLNCVMTCIAVALVERAGRKFLLKLGTAGIIVALLFAGLVYRHFESQRVDVGEQIAQRKAERELIVPVDAATWGASDRPMQLTVLYRYANRQGVAAAFSSDKEPRLIIRPGADDKGELVIERAKYGPVPSQVTAWLVAAAMCLFVAAFAIGPGVCVWLALCELMPTRIRSVGMGIALFLNTFVCTALTAVFLPIVGKYGYSAMFFFCAGCTVLYFITAAFFMPETKGKTLEEIEDYFEGKRS